MKTILPNAVRLQCTRKGRRATFVYEEDFDNVAIVKRSAKILGSAAMPGIKLEALGKTMRVSGMVDYSTLASMMTTEFLCWSKIGEMSLRDLLIGTFVGARQARNR